MVPGGKADEKNFRDPRVDAGAHRSSRAPANGTRLPAGTREVALRGAAWAGDLTVAARRRLDRFRRDLDAGDARAAEEPLRLAPLDREREAALGRLLRDLGRAPPTRAAACSRTSPPTGTRRATAAIRCTASRSWSAEPAIVAPAQAASTEPLPAVTPAQAGSARRRPGWRPLPRRRPVRLYRPRRKPGSIWEIPRCSAPPCRTAAP